jgi:hypothetical protein
MLVGARRHARRIRGRWRTLGIEKTIALLPDHLRRRVVGTTLGTPPRLSEISNGSAKAMTVIRHAVKHVLSS